MAYVRSSSAAILLLLATGQSALADDFFAVTPSKTAEVIFSDNSRDAVSKLSSRCIDAHWTIISSSETELICEAPLNFGQSVVGQLLLGNSYSTPPRRFFRFNVGSINGVSRVQASGWMELQMAFGQTRRTDFGGPEFQNSIFGFLMSAGGNLPVGTTFPNHAMMGVEGEFSSDGHSPGYKVRQVAPNSPASVADVQISDTISRVAGKQVKNEGALLDALAKAAKSPTYKVEVFRAGAPVSLELARAFRPTVIEEVKPVEIIESVSVASRYTTQSSFADEMIKLAKLRDDKILTEEEFQARKAKLLAQ